jgi:ribosomal protein S27AE
MNHSTDASAASPSALECPRCGHLVGAMADEADRRGETHGKCGECGLDIEWNTLRRTALAPPWLVEARYSPRHIVRRAFGTLVRTARPFRFWSAIELALPLSGRRLAVFIIAVLALLHGLPAAKRLLTDVPPVGGAPPAASVERAAQVGRVALALVMPLTEYDGANIVYMTSRATNEIRTVPLLWESLPYLLQAAIPFRDSGVVILVQVSPGQTRAYGIWRRAGELLTPALQSASLAFVPATLLGPLTLLLLPASLRRARIRPRHFARLMAYTVALLIPLTACIFITDGFVREFKATRFIEPRFHLHPFGAFGELNPVLPLLIVAFALNAIWLTAAASRYLQLPNARGVGIACALIPLLVACLVTLSA